MHDVAILVVLDPDAAVTTALQHLDEPICPGTSIECSGAWH
jgi:hypothetical protein